MGIPEVLEDFDQRIKRLHVITKKSLTLLITAVDQLAQQNAQMAKFILESSPKTLAFEKTLGDINQSIGGIQTRLKELARQVDQA